MVSKASARQCYQGQLHLQLRLYQPQHNTLESLRCRGLVACAGEHREDKIVPNSNNSQFFIVFDHCQAWNRKHTIFGKITGDSQFNLANISEVEVKPARTAA